MPDQNPPSFRYRLDQETPRLGPGGITRGASVREFPASIGIAGVSMRLEPGGMRELHWHANAAEWGYVVSGSCRTTILHPDGRPRRPTISIRATSGTFRAAGATASRASDPEECHFILIFDNGDFSEDHTFSVTDWMSRTPPAILAQSLGLSAAEVGDAAQGRGLFRQGRRWSPTARRSAPRAPIRRSSRCTAIRSGRRSRAACRAAASSAR